MRSCTAETIYQAYPGLSVRSAGIAPNAARQVNAEMLLWADKIFVMENMHRAYIIEKFPSTDVSKKMIVLHIPDFYYYMEPELIELLKEKVDPHLQI